MFLTSSLSSRDRNKYGGIWRRPITSLRDALSAISSRFIDEYFSLFAERTGKQFIPLYIYFRHERATMTSETSENSIFVRFYFTLCCLLLTQLLQLSLNLTAKLLLLTAASPDELLTAASPDELQANGSIQGKMTTPHFMPKPLHLITGITAIETIL